MIVKRSDGFSHHDSRSDDKNNKVIVSIVVPTFNSMSENKRIDRLLDSIFSQSYKDFEVIVVDNFSQDKTVDVCLEHPIALIQEKTTISRAWNIGLETAKGNYVLFIDSDMELPRSFLEECVNVIKKESPDCVEMDFTYVASREASFINVVASRNLELKLGAAPLNIYLYSTDFIGNTRFPESQNPLVGEEYIFRLNLLKRNPKIGKVTIKVIHYYDPSLSWLMRRCFKYGKWFKETKEHLKTREAVRFIHYNSIIKRQAIAAFVKLARNHPSLIPSFILYLAAKYLSFALGYVGDALA